jgi:predicted nuclease with TOPRIM domain
MSKVKQIQTKIDDAQANVAETIDSAQAKFQEAIDSAQAKVESIKAKVDQVEDKVEAKVDGIVGKIQYGIDWVKAAVETSGLTPSNLIDIAKIVIGRETVAQPIVLPFIKSLVVVQISEKPKTAVLKSVVESAIDA